MPSDNALTLVNRVLRTTGDYSQLATVVASPAGIADRIIDFLNITLDDLARKIEFPVLESTFQVVADGVNSIFISTINYASVASGVNCVVDGIGKLEEISRSKLMDMKAKPNNIGVYGQPSVFARQAGVSGELALEVFPLPAVGTVISVLANLSPTKFTTIDTSVTEIANNDLLVLGALAHTDAYDGLERGYMALYIKAKNDLWQQTYQSEQYRIETESYR